MGPAQNGTNGTMKNSDDAEFSEDVSGQTHAFRNEVYVNMMTGKQQRIYFDRHVTFSVWNNGASGHIVQRIKTSYNENTSGSINIAV